MENRTTNSSNDESGKRKKVSTEETDDETVKALIETWDEGKGIYVAAIDPQFIEIIKNANENEASSSEGTTGNARVKTEQAVEKILIDMINEPSLTSGNLKTQDEKTKSAREGNKKKPNEPKPKKERPDEEKGL